MPLIRKPITSAKAPLSTLANVVRGLSSPEADERWAAARAAVDITGSTEALSSALSSEADARVREAMLTSLARINSPESIAAILPLLRSDAADLRAGALDTLRAMGGRISDHLPALLTDGDSDVRILSCELVRSLPGTKATLMLCDVLARENDSNVCAAAIDVLAEVGEASALPALAQCAARFRDTPFLTFTIQMAIDQIRSQSDRHA